MPTEFEHSVATVTDLCVVLPEEKEPVVSLEEFHWNAKRLLGEGFPKGIRLDLFDEEYVRHFGDQVKASDYAEDEKMTNWYELFWGHSILSRTFRIRISGPYYCVKVRRDWYEDQTNEAEIHQLIKQLQYKRFRRIVSPVKSMNDKNTQVFSAELMPPCPRKSIIKQPTGWYTSDSAFRNDSPASEAVTHEIDSISKWKKILVSSEKSLEGDVNAFGEYSRDEVRGFKRRRRSSQPNEDSFDINVVFHTSDRDDVSKPKACSPCTSPESSNPIENCIEVEPSVTHRIHSPIEFETAPKRMVVEEDFPGKGERYSNLIDNITERTRLNHDVIGSHNRYSQVTGDENYELNTSSSFEEDSVCQPLLSQSRKLVLHRVSELAESERCLEKQSRISLEEISPTCTKRLLQTFNSTTPNETDHGMISELAVRFLRGLPIFPKAVDILSLQGRRQFAPEQYLEAKQWCAYFVYDDLGTVLEGSRGFYCADERQTYFFNSGWYETRNVKLPPVSIVYGEIKSHGTSLLYFDIIDAGYFNGNNLSNKSVKSRRSCCEYYITATLHSQSVLPMRVKKHYLLWNLQSAIANYIEIRCGQIQEMESEVKISGIELIQTRGANQSDFVGFCRSMKKRYVIKLDTYYLSKKEFVEDVLGIINNIYNVRRQYPCP